MRRIFNQVFIFIAAVLFFGQAAPQKLTVEGLFKELNYEVSFYSLTNLNEESLSVVNAGNFYIITCDKAKEKETEIKFGGIIGKSYKFKNAGFDLEKFIFNNGFKIEITQNLESGKILYLYSDKLSGEKIVGGKKINLQIAVTKDFTIAGTPIILGSF